MNMIETGHLRLDIDCPIYIFVESYAVEAVPYKTPRTMAVS
jgi:hypothetical protein